MTAPKKSGFWAGVVRLWAFDLRRFRVPIALLVSLELLRATLAEWAVHRGPVLANTAFGGTSAEFEMQTLDAAVWLAAALTTAMLIQADHPADDRAFLGSRPIGLWSIVIAKLTLLAGLTALLPFLATAARLLAYGAPPAAVAASAVQFVVISGAVVIPSAALALATRTLPRFLAAAGGLAMCWSVAVAAIVSMGPRGPFSDDLVFRVTNRWMLHTFAPPLTDWQSVDDRGWPFGLAMTLIAAAILASFYRTRRAVATTLAGAALVAAPALLPAAAPLSPVPADLTASLRQGVRLPTLSIPSASLMAKMASSGTSPGGLPVFGDVVLPPLPADVSVERHLGPVRVAVPGLELRVDGLGLIDRDASRASAAAGGSTEPVWTAETDSEMLFYLEPRDIDALRGRRVQVETRVDLRFTRHVLVADLPLRAGAAFRTPAYLVEIVSLAFEPRLSYVRCRFTRFPSFSRAHPNVMAFVAHADGSVVRLQAGLRPGFEPDFPDGRRVGWAHGRTWTRQLFLTIADLAAASPEARLRIVESRPAGDAQVALVARDVPVRHRELRPTPPADAFDIRIRGLD